MHPTNQDLREKLIAAYEGPTLRLEALPRSCAKNLNCDEADCPIPKEIEANN